MPPVNNTKPPAKPQTTFANLIKILKRDASDHVQHEQKNEQTMLTKASCISRSLMALLVGTLVLVALAVGVTSGLTTSMPFAIVSNALFIMSVAAPWVASYFKYQWSTEQQRVYLAIMCAATVLMMIVAYHTSKMRLIMYSFIAAMVFIPLSGNLCGITPKTS